MNRILIVLVTLLLLASCTETGETAAEAELGGAQSPAASSAGAEEGGNSAETRQSLDQIQQELGIPVLSEPWFGDLDGMIERRVIRVLTVYGIGTYFIENGQESGFVYELFRMFENEINKREGKKTVRVHVVFIPVARDELIPGLLEGHGDIAAAGLTITPERLALVDFTIPLTRKLSEVLVTGPSAPAIASIEELSGREMYVRASSSYRASLDALNRRFISEGIEPVIIEDVSDFLEDDDILEMVNAGSLEWAIVDDYKARIYAELFDKLVVREDIVFRDDAQMGYAMRKDSPQLMSALNRFVETHRQGTLTGNILINRYIRDFDWTHNVLNEDAYKRFEDVVGIFEEYGEQYGIDYLIVTAQGYQESRLRQSARSKAGAIGIMQMLPSTAADPNVGIPDISTPESNIHAGVKYLNFIRDRYFRDPAIDDLNRTLFALASYNAGPARVANLRLKAEQQGYDPNKWFDNVEMIAAREIGSETVQYVANILKYYVVYRLIVIRTQQRLNALGPQS